MYEKGTDQFVKALQNGDRGSHDETPLDPDDIAISTENSAPDESCSRVLSWLLPPHDASSVSDFVRGQKYQVMPS